MPTRNRSRGLSCFIILLGILLIFLPLAAPVLTDKDCGAIPVWKFRKEANLIVNDLIEAEKATNEFGELPVYLQTKLENDIYKMGYIDYPSCAQSARTKLSCALSDGKDYLKWKNAQDPQVNQWRTSYRACLTQYYAEIEELNRCWPFCSLSLSSSIDIYP